MHFMLLHTDLLKNRDPFVVKQNANVCECAQELRNTLEKKMDKRNDLNKLFV